MLTFDGKQQRYCDGVKRREFLRVGALGLAGLTLTDFLDSRAERSRTGHITFQNIIATNYHVLGVDTRAQLIDYNGRPQNLLNDTQPIRELVA